MHDLTFAKEILKSLDEKSKTLPKKTRIIGITVALSPLTHVKKETLIEAYKTVSPGTGFEAVKLNIIMMKLQMSCTDCGKEFLIDSPTFNCPRCNSSSIDMADNREFLVESIETS